MYLRSYYYIFVVIVVLLSGIYHSVVDDLLNAVTVADVSAVKKLMETKDIFVAGRVPIQPNRADKAYGRTALMMCGFDPQQAHDVVDKSCVKIGKLLTNAGADVTIVDFTGMNALHLAALRGMPKFSSFLIQQVMNDTMIDNESQITIEAEDGHSPSSSTAETFNSKHNRKMEVNRTAVRQFIDQKDEDGRTALMKAVAHGHLSTVRTIAKFGVNLSMRDNYNATVLHYAVQSVLQNSTRLPILQVLLSIANTTHTAVGRTNAGNSEKQVATVDMMDMDGRTPLMYAVIGHPKHTLTTKETNKKSEDDEFDSDQVYVELIQSLLKAGSDPRLLDSFGVSSISMCPAMSYVRPLLAEAAANIAMNEYEIFQDNYMLKT